jgi:hypothetical protein
MTPAPLHRCLAPLDPRGGLPDWWGPLAERAANNNPFLTSVWMQTWLEHYGQDFAGTWVEWRSDTQTVGGCLIVDRRVKDRWLLTRTVFLNSAAETRARSPMPEFNGVLHLPGHEVAIGKDLASFINLQRWTRVALEACSELPLTSTLLQNLDAGAHDLETRPSPFVDLRALAGRGYTATLSANTRSQLNRSRKRYETTRGPITLTPAGTLEEALTLLSELARLHNTRWNAEGQRGAFEDATFRAFHERLIERLWGLGGVELLAVRAGERPLGFLYNLLQGDKVYFYQSGIPREADGQLKPGLISHARAIQHYADRGFAEYDFLAGDAQYKRSLSNAERRLTWHRLYRRNPLGRSLWLLKNLKRRWLRRPAH